MALVPKNYKKEKSGSSSNQNPNPGDSKDLGGGTEQDSERDLAEDGRSKEWADRARINLHPDPDAKTNLERDFEPEQDPEPKKDDPVY